VIITCEKCQTRFQLDDSRVPENGLRARCSRCEHAFFVKPMPESGGDFVEGAVSQALEEHAKGDAVGARGELREAAESDWEFNHDDDPGHDAALAEAREMVDDLLDCRSPFEAESAAKEAYFGGSDDVEEDGASLLGDTSQSLEIENDDAPAGAPAERHEGVAAVDEPESPASESDLPTPVDALGSDLVDEDEFIDVLGEIGDEPYEAVDLAAGPPLEDPVADAPATPEPVAAEDPQALLSDEDLGNPDGWDFFADEGSEATPPGALPTDRAVLGRIEVGPPGSFESAPVHEEPPVVEAAPSPLAAWIVRGGTGVGWVAASLLAASVLVTGLGPQVAPTPAASAAAGLVGVQARQIDNAIAGTIVVIEASLPANAAGSRATGDRFAVQLLDANGVVVVEDAASLAPAHAEAELRESSPVDLRGSLAQESLAHAWQPVALSPRRTLHAVLADVPAVATHFEIVRIPVEPPSEPAHEPELAESSG